MRTRRPKREKKAENAPKQIFASTFIAPPITVVVNLDIILSCLPATMSQVREYGENLFLCSDKKLICFNFEKYCLSCSFYNPDKV